jgi:hypothetical protein
MIHQPFDLHPDHPQGPIIALCFQREGMYRLKDFLQLPQKTPILGGQAILSWKPRVAI